jgi:nucleoside phosphorylase
MDLLVFAYLKEATSFIDGLDLKKENISLNNVFSKKDILLLITDEGVSNVITQLTSILDANKKSITRVLNFGVAGRLDSKLSINECYEVNVVTMGEKSYNLETVSPGISCITSHYMVSNPNEAGELSRLAQIVDMELWAIADVALAFNVPVRAVKCISDDAWKQTPPEEIKKNAKFYSEQLFDYFSRHF